MRTEEEILTKLKELNTKYGFGSDNEIIQTGSQISILNWVLEVGE